MVDNNIKDKGNYLTDAFEAANRLMDENNDFREELENFKTISNKKKKLPKSHIKIMTDYKKSLKKIVEMILYETKKLPEKQHRPFQFKVKENILRKLKS